MKIIAKREAILSPLQAVIGVVERKQTMPILANVLVAAKGGKLSITATDLEVELVATSDVDVQRGGEITIPGRKLLDICRALPEGTEMCMPGDNTPMTVILHAPIAMDEGLRFAIREGGRTVGAGRVTKILK